MLTYIKMVIIQLYDGEVRHYDADSMGYSIVLSRFAIILSSIDLSLFATALSYCHRLTIEIRHRIVTSLLSVGVRHGLSYYHNRTVAVRQRTVHHYSHPHTVAVHHRIVTIIVGFFSRFAIVLCRTIVIIEFS